jgi:hypothetical protein
MIVTVGTELQRWPRASIPPGSDHPEGRLVYSRKRIDATNDFLIIIEYLLLCFSIEDGGRIDREYVPRIQSGLSLLQCEQCRHQHARAGEQNK